ncbi:MAG TPA: amino acid permease, partial [Candidatus Paceibacterota bacterium]|nr:amino acid permease [Candidatus Paceibacterota bacterium]
MHHHKINGEGLFGFVNMVLGSNASFIFASSIVVTYLLTICISSVSVIGNNLYLLPDNDNLRIILTLFIIWGVTLIELLGIKISQKIYYYSLVFLIILFLNLIILGIISFDSQKVNYFLLFFNNSIKT